MKPREMPFEALLKAQGERPPGLADIVDQVTGRGGDGLRLETAILGLGCINVQPEAARAPDDLASYNPLMSYPDKIYLPILLFCKE